MSSPQAPSDALTHESVRSSLVDAYQFLIEVGRRAGPEQNGVDRDGVDVGLTDDEPPTDAAASSSAQAAA